MYRHLMIATVLLLSSCAVQPLQQSDLKVLTLGPTGLFYEEVIPLSGVSAAELYERALAWVIGTNGSIEFQDKEGKKIVERNVYTVSFMIINVKVFHTISLEARDGRFKVRFDAFTVLPPEGGEWDLAKAGPIQVEIVHNTENAVTKTVENLKTSMTADQGDKW